MCTCRMYDVITVKGTHLKKEPCEWESEKENGKKIDAEREGGNGERFDARMKTGRNRSH